MFYYYYYYYINALHKLRQCPCSLILLGIKSSTWDNLWLTLNSWNSSAGSHEVTFVNASDRAVGTRLLSSNFIHISLPQKALFLNISFLLSTQCTQSCSYSTSRNAQFNQYRCQQQCKKAPSEKHHVDSQCVHFQAQTCNASMTTTSYIPEIKKNSQIFHLHQADEEGRPPRAHAEPIWMLCLPRRVRESLQSDSYHTFTTHERWSQPLY